jgi:hypothetical protein
MELTWGLHAETFEKRPFCPISRPPRLSGSRPSSAVACYGGWNGGQAASDSDFNPPKSYGGLILEILPDIPAVKIFASLDLGQNISFRGGHYLE